MIKLKLKISYKTKKNESTQINMLSSEIMRLKLTHEK